MYGYFNFVEIKCHENVRLIGLLAKSTQFPHAKPTIPFDYVSGKLSAIIPAVPFPSPAVASIDPVSSSNKVPQEVIGKITFLSSSSFN